MSRGTPSRRSCRARVQTVYEFELGFKRESLAKQKVMGLVAGSAAAKAGLKEGDELVGWDVSGGDPDKEVRLVQVLRKPDIVTVSYLPRGKKSEVLQFSATKEDGRRAGESGRRGGQKASRSGTEGDREFDAG